MKALIHIGMPKAGSSSIQAFLKRNSDALAAQGVRYAPLTPRFGSQYELAMAGLLRAGGQMRDEVALKVLGMHDLAAQRAHVEKFERHLLAGRKGWSESLFVGSSEHIHAWLGQAEQIAALDDFLRGHFESVHYLVYLRPQEEAVLSAWSERIRRGETVDFDTHLRKRLRWMNYWKSVRLWASTVGEERFTPRLLVSDALADGELIADFCAQAGVDPAGLAMPRRMNQALSAEAIALRRRLNRFLRVRNRAGRYSKLYFTSLKALGWWLPRPGTRPALSEAQRALVREACATGNEKLRARYFPERETLF